MDRENVVPVVGWMLFGRVLGWMLAFVGALWAAWSWANHLGSSADCGNLSFGGPTDVREALNTFTSVVVTGLVAITAGALTAHERIRVTSETLPRTRRGLPSHVDFVYRLTRVTSDLAKSAAWLEEPIAEEAHKLISALEDSAFMDWVRSEKLPPKQFRNTYVSRAEKTRDAARRLLDLLEFTHEGGVAEEHRRMLLQAVKALDRGMRSAIVDVTGEHLKRSSTRLAWTAACLAALILYGALTPEPLFAEWFTSVICPKKEGSIVVQRIPTQVLCTFYAFGIIAVVRTALRLRAVFLKALEL